MMNLCTDTKMIVQIPIKTITRIKILLKLQVNSFLETCLIGSSTNEKRTKINPKLTDYTGQVCFVDVKKRDTMSKENIYGFVGSGLTIQYEDIPAPFVLTCGHNFHHYDADDMKTYKFTYGFVELGKNGDKSIAKIPIKDYSIHPDYKNTLTSTRENDLAVGMLDLTTLTYDECRLLKLFMRQKESFSARLDDKKSLLIGTRIFITGHPGEKKGEMYSMSGTIHSIIPIVGTRSLLL